jgi:acetylornithine deacetylase
MSESPVVSLAKRLIAIPSPSQISNQAIADCLTRVLEEAGFTVEALAYDDNGRRKVSLIARKGAGAGGLGLFSHSDTVPGGDGWDPFVPEVGEGRLIGRGATDMKGPLAATLVAASGYAVEQLRRPLTLVITADEEIGYGGAQQVASASQLLKDNWPAHAVVAEPTRLRPVYAHKGGTRFTVTAYGRAAHTSTDNGYSANFLIAPFMAEMARLAPIFKTDPRFQNDEFAPPTNGFNMVVDDGGTAANVYAAKTVCTVGLRTMPDDHHEEAYRMILDAAAKHGLEVDWYSHDPFYADRSAPVVIAALEATGLAAAETVPFGTEAAVYKDFAQVVVLGPGDIAQAHTVGEWIDIAELERAVEVYRRLIDRFCVNGE